MPNMLPQDLLKDHLEAWLQPQAEKNGASEATIMSSII